MKDTNGQTERAKPRKGAIFALLMYTLYLAYISYCCYAESSDAYRAEHGATTQAFCMLLDVACLAWGGTNWVRTYRDITSSTTSK